MNKSVRNLTLVLALMTIAIHPGELIAQDELAQNNNDSWTLPDSIKGSTPVEVISSGGENDINKWCADDGDHVRYASGNISLQGYHRCGSVSVEKTCDPLGNRYFGPATNAPYSYADCAKGQRIYIERDGVPVSLKELNQPEVPVTSAREERRAREVVRESKRTERIAKEHNDYMDGLDDLLDGFSNTGHHPRRSGKQADNPLGGLDLESIKSLTENIDPEQIKEMMQLLPQLIGNSKQSPE